MSAKSTFGALFLRALFGCTLGLTAARAELFKLQWVDNSPDEDGFCIERADGDGAPMIQIFVTGPNVTSHTDDTPAPNRYRYRVRAFNAIGFSEYTSVVSNGAFFVTNPPATVTVATGGSTTISAVAGGVPTPATFQWERSTDGGTTFTNLVADSTFSNVNTSTLTITGATSALNNHRFRLTASNVVMPATSTAAVLSVTNLPTFSNPSGGAGSTSGTVGSAFSYTLAASGVPTPTFTVTSGTLPAGLALTSGTSGLISGTPTAATPAGGTTVTFTATNTGGTATATVTFNIGTSGTVPVITSPVGGVATVNGTVGTVLSTFTLIASGSPAPTFAVTSGTLPAGLTLSTAGAITGTPTTSTTGTAVTITASNTSGSAAATLTFVIAAPPAITNPAGGAAAVAGTVGTAFNYTLSASGSPAPTFAVTTGTLPAGLSLASNGVISGTPTAATPAGGTAVTFTATNASGTAPATLTFSVGAASTPPPAPPPPPPPPPPVLPTTPTAGTAPAILTQPANQTVAPGGSATFSVVASGNLLIYQWRKDGANISGATGSSYTVTNATTADAGSYSVFILNAIDSVTSNGATLFVQSPPAIISQPSSQTVVLGSSVTFTVGATGLPVPTYQWLKDGSPIAGATGSSLSLSAVTLEAAGKYSVVVTNSRGTITSAEASLLVNKVEAAGIYFGTFPSGATWALQVRPDNTATFMTYLPGDSTAIVTELTVAPDGTFTISGSSLATLPLVATNNRSGPSTAAAPVPFSLSGRIANGSVTGQLSGLALTGAADTGAQGSAGFYRAPALLASTGTTYSIIGPSGKAFVITTTPTTIDALTSNLGANNQLSGTSVGGGQIALSVGDLNNISVSYTPAGATAPIVFSGISDAAPVTTGLSNLSIRTTAGTGAQTLIVGFAVSGGTKPILVRGVGPGLAAFGVQGTVADPRLDLSRLTGGASVGTNDNWSAAAADVFAQVGAFGLPAGSRDAAIVATLGADSYTAQVADVGGGTGIALVELYDTAPGTGAKLANVSARSTVGTGNSILIAGFNLSGNGPRSLLIRAVGPALTGFGVAGALADPRVDLYTAGAATPIAGNDNWEASSAASFTQVGAFGLTAGSRDAALVVTLNPGSYTVQVSGVGSTTGVALVELYELP